MKNEFCSGVRMRRCMWACTFFLASVYLNYHGEYAWGTLCSLAMLVNAVLSEDFSGGGNSKKEDEND